MAFDIKWRLIMTIFDEIEAEIQELNRQYYLIQLECVRNRFNGIISGDLTNLHAEYERALEQIYQKYAMAS